PLRKAEFPPVEYALCGKYLLGGDGYESTVVRGAARAADDQTDRHRLLGGAARKRAPRRRAHTGGGGGGAEAAGTSPPRPPARARPPGAHAVWPSSPSLGAPRVRRLPLARGCDALGDDLKRRRPVALTVLGAGARGIAERAVLRQRCHAALCEDSLDRLLQVAREARFGVLHAHQMGMDGEHERGRPTRL